MTVIHLQLLRRKTPSLSNLSNPATAVIELEVIIVKVSRHSYLGTGYQHGDVVLRLVKEDGGVAPAAQEPVVDAGHSLPGLCCGSQRYLK